MPPEQPTWRKTFDAVDGRIAPAVESAARSDVFNDVLGLTLRLRRRVQREAERQTRRVLHTFNVPTATDVKRLSQQVAALQREVRAAERRRARDPR